ncbi:MAG: hypothetical protein JXA19_04360 [Anaerolineales bacterium]|nr:hypothetical protein [Anaerolineales bacterium]
MQEVIEFQSIIFQDICDLDFYGEAIWLFDYQLGDIVVMNDIGSVRDGWKNVITRKDTWECLLDFP